MPTSYAIPTPTGSDSLPGLVHAFVQQERQASALLAEVLRHVERVTRPYPPAWFALGRKEPEAVQDLADRVFTTCARVEKGRFPFLGATPFRAYVRERFDGRTIRYHSFYAKLSITRELMHVDYAHNVVRDPVLRWQADLHREIGRELQRIGVAEGEGRARRWRLREPAGLRSLVTADALGDALHATRKGDVPSLVHEALSRAGPLTHVQVTRALAAVLDAPAPEPAAQEERVLDTTERAAIRAAVLNAWATLSADERALLLLVVRGATFQEITARYPRFKDPATLTHTIRRCNDALLSGLVEPGGARPTSPSERAALTPRALLDRVFEVLLSCLPALEFDPHEETP